MYTFIDVADVCSSAHMNKTFNSLLLNLPIPIPHLLPVIQERKTVESSVNYILGCHSSEHWSWHHDVCHVTLDSRCSLTIFFFYCKQMIKAEKGRATRLHQEWLLGYTCILHAVVSEDLRTTTIHVHVHVHVHMPATYSLSLLLHWDSIVQVDHAAECKTMN